MTFLTSGFGFAGIINMWSSKSVARCLRPSQFVHGAYVWVRAQNQNHSYRKLFIAYLLKGVTIGELVLLLSSFDVRKAAPHEEE